MTIPLISQGAIEEIKRQKVAERIFAIVNALQGSWNILDRAENFLIIHSPRFHPKNSMAIRYRRLFIGTAISGQSLTEIVDNREIWTVNFSCNVPVSLIIAAAKEGLEE